jgi:hypothetical protein
VIDAPWNRIKPALGLIERKKPLRFVIATPTAKPVFFFFQAVAPGSSPLAQKARQVLLAAHNVLIEASP